MDEEDQIQTVGSDGAVPLVDTQPLVPITQTEGSTTNSTASGSTSGSTSGSGTPFGIPMKDFLYDQGIQVDPIKQGEGLKAVGLTQKDSFIINDHVDGDSSILINSGRVIINSKNSHTIIAGAKGIALTSPAKVNIDADQSVTLFGAAGLYLGIPNAGLPPKPIAISPTDTRFYKDGKKLKSYPSADVPYEPMVLGLKLINWLDDLLIVLKYNQILTPVGLGTAREDTQWDFIALQSRLKELISTQIFVDGYSHEIPDFDGLPEPPKEVTKTQTSINVNANFTLSPLAAPGPVTATNSSRIGYYDAPAMTLPTLN